MLGVRLLLLDSTWRLLPQIEACLHGEGVRRTLPAVQTAYPRLVRYRTIRWGAWLRWRLLYLAKLMLGERDDCLLDAYYWRAGFLENLKQAGLL